MDAGAGRKDETGGLLATGSLGYLGIMENKVETTKMGYVGS